MTDILEYQLAIGQTFFVVDLHIKSIKKGVCRLVEIKTYLKQSNSDNDPEVISEVKYLIETEFGETFMVLEKDVYKTFAEAASVLQQSFDS
jgi:hypothetical protein